MNHSVEGLYPFLMKKGAFLRHNEQILSFIDLSFSFFAETVSYTHLTLPTN